MNERGKSISNEAIVNGMKTLEHKLKANINGFQESRKGRIFENEISHEVIKKLAINIDTPAAEARKQLQQLRERPHKNPPKFSIDLPLSFEGGGVVGPPYDLGWSFQQGDDSPPTVSVDGIDGTMYVDCISSPNVASVSEGSAAIGFAWYPPIQNFQNGWLHFGSYLSYNVVWGNVTFFWEAVTKGFISSFAGIYDYLGNYVGPASIANLESYSYDVDQNGISGGGGEDQSNLYTGGVIPVDANHIYALWVWIDSFVSAAGGGPFWSWADGFISVNVPSMFWWLDSQPP
jgi:hypothetical protein